MAEAEESMQAYNQIWSLTLEFAAPFAVKAALKLGIFDIISKSESKQGATLEDISKQLELHGHVPQGGKLYRLLRFLVFKDVLTLNTANSRYGLTPMSEMLVRGDNNLFVAPILSFFTSEVNQLCWQHIDSAISMPGDSNPFIRAHGMDPGSYVRSHPEFGEFIEMFRVAMKDAEFTATMRCYRGFEGIRRLVDVGGGTGSFIAEIVKVHPHIEAFNFDLPQAFANAQPYPSVKNVPGNAMESIPSADGIFMKNFLHMFSDSDASKILANCYKALENNGKVIISDMVMDESKELHLLLDMQFLNNQRYERTRGEWESLLASSGFERISFYDIGTPFSIVEAIKA